MKTNADLREKVLDALQWEPLLKKAEIGVITENGIVTLTGFVDSYAKKLKAESTVKRIKGVRVLVEKLEVRFGFKGVVTDTEIANEILNAIKWNWEIPNDAIKVKVENSWVTLEGELEWNFQRETARKLVGNLLGVKGVTNKITIKTETHGVIDKDAILAAISRDWSINSDEIDLNITDKKVTLSGLVHSLYQKHQAEKIVWSTPGVWFVDNNLEVGFDY
ncbi:BON domain-containing protein [Flavobacterium sp. SUN046]|uniref:BON domain-containing protein n=1 Tax=Flavobacterium sp. SUN046 TaxID=3002440 RepID=UPI002DBA1E78|nr:BON domain-containing protein [Flavobacterium sp. SUN046]MEC4049916.1 BON domain-containing protein [Flavobacterium sp. SUN046]